MNDLVQLKAALEDEIARLKSSEEDHVIKTENQLVSFINSNKFTVEMPSGYKTVACVDQSTGVEVEKIEPAVNSKGNMEFHIQFSVRAKSVFSACRLNLKFIVPGAIKNEELIKKKRLKKKRICVPKLKLKKKKQKKKQS